MMVLHNKGTSDDVHHDSVYDSDHDDHNNDNKGCGDHDDDHQYI